MESFPGAAASIGFALALAFACGYGVVSFLLPQESRELRIAAMPATGYVAFCLLVMVVSGNFLLSVRVSVWLALAFLLALSVAAAVRRARRAGGGMARAPWALMASIVLPTLVVAVGPTLAQGTELYLGSVNLDFFQSMIYEDVLRLKDLPVFGYYAMPEGTRSIALATKLWPDLPQARFGGVMFAFLVRSLTGLSAKSSLTATTAMFALCVPLSIHFFSRVVLGLSTRAAALAAVLAGTSAPLTMSYLYVLVGQSSGLPVLPLAVAVLFMTLRAPTPRLVAYSAILVLGLFWLYALMLPFALAPMGLLGLYLVLARRLTFARAAAIAAGLALALLLAWGAMIGELLDFFHGLASISGRLAGTVFFVDFLTELFFVYFFGITTYTFSNSLLFRGLGAILPGGAAAWGVAVAGSAAVLAFIAVSVAAWRRTQADDARRKALGSLLLVYGAVWLYFTFARPYGYSAFKMAVWLQFAAIPLVAFGIAHFWNAGRRWRRIAAAIAVVYIGANLAGAVDYDHMSFGTDRQRGYIVNAFGMGDNPDWARLGQDVAAHVRPAQTVAIAFTDAIQNDWAAYRLTGVATHSILSHAQLPEDDAFLPDPRTGVTSDTSGQVKTVEPLRYGDVASDYFLLPGERNLNPEIVEQPLPAPVWQNGTFRLQAGADLRDFLFLGRGFYREGFPGPDRPWWQPAGASRWMRNGGEFYLFQAAHPGQPYRLSFTAMVGFGYPSASRTLEFWHGDRKFDERVVTDVARIVSRPFYPNGKLDRVTVVIREQTRPFARPLGLWNRDVPEDTRNLNLYVSSARLVPPGAQPGGGSPAARMDGGKEILRDARLYDGLSADAWVNEAASLSLVAPFDHPRLVLELKVPGNLGFAFPYHVRLQTNGVERDFVAARPGTLRAEIDLPQVAAREAIDLSITPGQHARVDDAFANANRPIVQSVRIDSIRFLPRG